VEGRGGEARTTGVGEWLLGKESGAKEAGFRCGSSEEQFRPKNIGLCTQKKDWKTEIGRFSKPTKTGKTIRNIATENSFGFYKNQLVFKTESDLFCIKP
jgi:hypothetical protein